MCALTLHTQISENAEKPVWLLDHRAHNQLDTPEREWIPARLGRNALHGIAFSMGRGWFPSGTQVYVMRKISKGWCKVENVWEDKNKFTEGGTT